MRLYSMTGRRSAGSKRQRGLSLIEMMVGLTLGLIVVTALTVLFVSNSRARQESEKTSQQIENGRYASQLLLDEMHLAGYYGEFNPQTLASPAALPDPSASDVPSLSAALALPLQGYDNGANMPSGVQTLLTDLRPGTDVLVIRRTSNCVAGATGCDAANMAVSTYFQTALCTSQLGVLPPASQFLLGSTQSFFTSSNPAVTGGANPPAFLAAKDCATPAVLRAYYVRIYFVTNNDQAGDGIPTLKVAELGAGQFNVTPLVEGIDQLQLEYGIDADGNGSPDSYTTNPGSVAGWRTVTAVKVHILARNAQSSNGYVDSRSYVLGLQSNGNPNTYGPFSDAYKRHVYTTMARLNNVAGRLE